MYNIYKTSVFDVGPALYKWYINVLCLLGFVAIFFQKNNYICLTCLYTILIITKVFQYFNHVNMSGCICLFHSYTMTVYNQARQKPCMSAFLSRKITIPRKHEPLVQCWFNMPRRRRRRGNIKPALMCTHTAEWAKMVSEIVNRR